MVAPGAIDINTDPGHGRTTGPDMILTDPGLDVTMAPVDSTGRSAWPPQQHGPRNSMAPTTAWPKDTNTVPGGGSDPWH